LLTLFLFLSLESSICHFSFFLSFFLSVQNFNPREAQSNKPDWQGGANDPVIGLPKEAPAVQPVSKPAPAFKFSDLVIDSLAFSQVCTDRKGACVQVCAWMWKRERAGAREREEGRKGEKR
jgi:hypothetical protein